jgi:hypothetical protein
MGDLFTTMCLRHNIFRSIPQFGCVVLCVYMWTDWSPWLSKLIKASERRAFPCLCCVLCLKQVGDAWMNMLLFHSRNLACSMMSWWHVWLLPDLWSPNSWMQYHISMGNMYRQSTSTRPGVHCTAQSHTLVLTWRLQRPAVNRNSLGRLQQPAVNGNISKSCDPKIQRKIHNVHCKLYLHLYIYVGSIQLKALRHYLRSIMGVFWPGSESGCFLARKWIAS